MVIGALGLGTRVTPTKTPLLNTKMSIDQHINLRKRASQSFRFYYRTNIYMLSD